MLHSKIFLSNVRNSCSMAEENNSNYYHLSLPSSDMVVIPRDHFNDVAEKFFFSATKFILRNFC